MNNSGYEMFGVCATYVDGLYHNPREQRQRRDTPNVLLPRR